MEEKKIDETQNEEIETKDLGEMTSEEVVNTSTEEEPTEEKVEEEQNKEIDETQNEETDEISEEEEAAMKLPFPTAAVVRIMKATMDDEKMIRKEVKVAMNKWLGDMCSRVSREMNKFPYVMMNINEFKEGIKVFESLSEFQREKDRILAHLDAIKKDIGKLEWDLGKREDEFIVDIKRQDSDKESNEEETADRNDQ